MVESKIRIGSWLNSSSQRLNQELETHSYCEASLFERHREERRFLRAPFPLPPLPTLLPFPPPPSLIQFRSRVTSTSSSSCNQHNVHPPQSTRDLLANHRKRVSVNCECLILKGERLIGQLSLLR